MSKHPEMYRLYRFVKWYRALRRWNEFGLSHRQSVEIAWYWSSDEAAFLSARQP